MKYQKYLDQLPAEFQNQILKYRNWEDAQRSLYGKLLLKSGLEYLQLNGYKLSDIKYSAHQRPYFDHTFDFNIAHSGEFVLCAISKTHKVGVDIEEVRATELNDFHDYFNGQEWEKIINSNQHFHEFYKLWTQKEAIIKASGEGLSIPLKEVLIKDNEAVVNNEKWHLIPLSLNQDYVSYLATDSDSSEVTVQQIEFD
ncbi:4'-phosphopantetheinyl transferase [Flammeovirgaceae bacterium 311]|nr:4'-phosphopantetheinyl transferase [Flammeovirgaceae bacterium 311]